MGVILNGLKAKIKNESILWSVLLAVFFFIAYGYTNYWSSTLPDVPSFVFSWEHQIPFIPWMIVPYMSSDLIFILCFLLLTDRKEVRLMAKRIGFLIAFSILCYRFFPLKVAFKRPDLSHSMFSTWFKLLENDLPYNQCPSLHVSEGLLFRILFGKLSKNLLSKSFTHIWFTFVMVSTLTLYQHHFIDILAGLALALATLILIPTDPSSQPKHGEVHFPRIGRFELVYYLVSWISFSGIFFSESMTTQILLGYFSLSFLALATSYTFGYPNIISKRKGTIQGISKIIFAPYLLLCWIEWRWYATFEPKPMTEVIPNLFFGRRLSSVTELENKSNFVMIDLAPEISEIDLHKNEYFFYPILDMTHPNSDLQERIFDQIEFLLEQKKSVYIHCRLGRARSGWIIFRFLVERYGMNESEAIERMSKSKKIHLPFLKLRQQ